jgi:hypothetical protein
MQVMYKILLDAFNNKKKNKENNSPRRGWAGEESNGVVLFARDRHAFILSG